MSKKISVLIPVLDDLAELKSLYGQLEEQTGVDLEILICDGGETTDVEEFCRQRSLVHIRSPKGRGRQLNAGAKRAGGDWLLVLHADSSLTSHKQVANALALMTSLERPAVGHFPLRFVGGEGKKYRFYEAKTRLNFFETQNGDQGLLVSRELFFKLCGFNEKLPFLEDQYFNRQVARAGIPWISLPDPLGTSIRRFESEGMAGRMIQSALIMAFLNVGWDAFFDQVEDLYREQARTGKPHMSHFFSKTWSLFWKVPFRRRLKLWLDLGRYIRAQLWQIGLLFDVVLEREEQKTFLKFFRSLQAVVEKIPGTGLLTSVLMIAWFFSSWAYFRFFL